MKRLIFALAAAAMMLAAPAFAQQSAPRPKTLFTNVNVFDGVNEKRIENANVLVEGNPLENLDLVADPDKNFAVIMKDGKIYKNVIK